MSLRKESFHVTTIAAIAALLLACSREHSSTSNSGNAITGTQNTPAQYLAGADTVASWANGRYEIVLDILHDNGARDHVILQKVNAYLEEDSSVYFLSDKEFGHIDVTSESWKKYSVNEVPDEYSAYLMRLRCAESEDDVQKVPAVTPREESPPAYSSRIVTNTGTQHTYPTTGGGPSTCFGAFYADFGRVDPDGVSYYRPLVITFARDPKGMKYETPDYDGKKFYVILQSGKQITMDYGTVYLLSPERDMGFQIADAWDIRLLEHENWLQSRRDFDLYIENLLAEFREHEPKLAKTIGLTMVFDDKDVGIRGTNDE